MRTAGPEGRLRSIATSPFLHRDPKPPSRVLTASLFPLLPATGCLAGNLPPRLGSQKRAHSSAYNLMVVGYKETNCGHHWPPESGSMARTLTPRPLASIASWPPSCLARSRIPAMPTPRQPPLPLDLSKTAGDIPFPSSLTSSVRSVAFRTIRIRAVALRE